MQARYDLAVEAIKTFHTGVSEDFLLKQDQFKELRDRLLEIGQRLLRQAGCAAGQRRPTLIHAGRWVTPITSWRTLSAWWDGQKKPWRPTGGVLTYREAMAAGPGASAGARFDVCLSIMGVANALANLGRIDEAIAALRKAESTLAGLKLQSHPASQPEAVRSTLASCRSRLASLLHSLGRRDEAMTMLRLARAEQEALAAAAPVKVESAGELPWTIVTIASLLAETGKFDEALAEDRAALAISEKLAAENPTVARFRNDLAMEHDGIGGLLREAGKLEQALAEHRAAMAVVEGLVAENPAVIFFQQDLADRRWAIAQTYHYMGKFPEALAAYRAATVLYQRLADEYPSVFAVREGLARSHDNIGSVLWGLGKLSEALAEYRTAMAIDRKLLEENPRLENRREELAITELQHRIPAGADGPVRRGARRIPGRPGDLEGPGR